MQIQGFQSSFVPKQTFNGKLNFKNKLSSDEIRFSGLHNTEDKALFVFNLDKTFSNASDMDIRQLRKLISETKAVLVYTTGRSVGSFFKFKNKLKEQGIYMPLPDYLIANNGQIIYENIKGNLIKDDRWTETIQETGFDSKKILDAIQKIAHKKYRYKTSELRKLSNLPDFELRKQEDPDYWDSKISFSDWCNSDYMLQYIVSPDVNIDKLKQDIAKELEQQGIKTKFILRVYQESKFKFWANSLIHKVKPMRQTTDGSFTSLYICPAVKADAVEYLSKKLDIKDSEILMSGDETNDVSMVDLVKNGSFLICLNNASELFKKYVLKAQKSKDNKFSANILLTENEGTSGIIEGIKKILYKIQTNIV